MKHEIWNMEHEIWNMEHGIWNMEYGTCGHRILPQGKLSGNLLCGRLLITEVFQKLVVEVHLVVSAVWSNLK